MSQRFSASATEGAPDGALRVRRPVILGLGLGITIALGAGGLAATSGGAQDQQPTFTRHVAPILYRNCAACHRPGGIGPMSLLTYDDARSMASEIREKVAGAVMPPWHADGPRGRFLNDRRLADADKQAILRWIDAGMPRGNTADMPPVPSFSDTWTIGTPDVVLSMAQEFEVPAQGTVEYQYFLVPTNFKEDRWVRAIEVMPGAREVVHHVLVYAGDSAMAARSRTGNRGDDRTPPPPGSSGSGGAPPLRRPLGSLIATTAPGTNAMTFPEGTALRVAAGSVLVFQMHYTTHGVAMKDRSSVGIIFAKEAPEQEMRASSFINARFVIPAGASDHKVESELSFRENVTIWGLLPHTHLRGKRWEYRLVKPDGQEEVVLSVPRYDFNWQTYYLFAEPLRLPAGSRIVATAWYDNSSANPSNPDPSVEVRWGEQTWEEMQYTGFLYTVGGGWFEAREGSAR